MTAASLLLRRSLSRKGLLGSTSSHARSLSFLTPAQLTQFQGEGIVDERGLVQFDTLHEMQERSCRVFEEKPLFGTYSEASKQFEWMKYQEFAQKVDTCRALLHDLGAYWSCIPPCILSHTPLGISANDKVGIISNNRWEWAAIASAAYSLQAVHVPMYQAQLPTDWTYILNDSGAKVVFCATTEIYHQVQTQVLPNCPGITAALCLDASAEEPHAFMHGLERMEGTSITPNAPSMDDLAGLIYTSGTTGKPKGVELTHHNFCTNVIAAARTRQDPHDMIRKDDCSLAFLPWAHSYGQTCELWMSLSHGAAIAVSRGIPSLLEDLEMTKPSVLFSVPALYKRIYDGVNNAMETASPLRRSMMQKALQLGRRNVEAQTGTGPSMSLWEQAQFSVLDPVVLGKIRARFGGKLRHGFVAGAATPREILNFMDSIGIPVCEGYGLTETSPIITINVPTDRSVGSVGRPIGGVSVYIVDEEGNPVAEGEEGEICCAGPNVMRGYYNNEEATAEVISTAPDGQRMFHTGDMGRLDKNDFLRVTGRIKEQYKMENGKYVVPGPVEQAIGLSRFISQVVLTGDNRPYNVALLVPEWPAIRTALNEEQMTEAELAKDPRVAELMDHAIEQNCAGLKKFEIPQKWALVPPFTAANNMLTPKMSIRRHIVITTYADVLGKLYGDVEVADEDEAVA